MSILETSDPPCDVPGCDKSADPNTHEWGKKFCTDHLRTLRVTFGAVPERVQLKTATVEDLEAKYVNQPREFVRRMGPGSGSGFDPWHGLECESDDEFRARIKREL